jgi:hypothetical protein
MPGGAASAAPEPKGVGTPSAPGEGSPRMEKVLARISEKLLGKRLDPFSGQTRQHIALIAFFAWVGLGADGLSSSCYGPEEAFLALGRHTHLGLYMALATVLLPIFMGFFITHVLLIIIGIAMKGSQLPALVPDTLSATSQLTQEMGWLFAASLFLRAYSLGGGTYTGIEAVSNNVQSLAEPRIATGKWTMFYMAVSLSFTAGGIILLYLLWNVQAVEGQTLNAVTFRAIIGNAGFNAPVLEHGLLWIILALEGGLLFVAANTGFLGGPAVLANMAADFWVPHMYRYLSTRLVTQKYFAHGDHVIGNSGGHRWQGGPAGRPLQHQRVPDVLNVAARPLHLLVATSRP